MLQNQLMSFIKNKSKGLIDMENMKSIEKTEQYQERIKELFKELVTDELYDAWGDTFDIEIIDEKQVLVIYHGFQSIKKFKKECKENLLHSIYSILGYKKKIKISKNKSRKAPGSKMKNNIKAIRLFVIGMIFVCFATAIIVVMCNYIGNRNFRETFYSTSSIKVDSRVRVIQLSDLHGSSYGNNNKKLLERIKALEPDIIICTGDMIDSDKDDEDDVVSLSGQLSKIAPSYYVYGNNEVESTYDFLLNEKELDKRFGFDANNRDEAALLQIEDSFEKRLESAGIKVLKNEKDTIKVKTMAVDIYGVLTSNPSSFWSYSGKAFADYMYENPDNLKITAIHEPFIFEEFSPEFWGDLMLSGHTHGGVVRVPMIGPLFTHEGGMFPERNGDFVYGRYNTAGNPLIVSAGLENSNIFRINNEPELVIIDINKF